METEKSALSSIELRFIVGELQVLAGAKVEQIYQVDKEEFTFQFHVPGAGKKILRLLNGRVMYLASVKGAAPEKPPGFCVYLRKKLKNSRVVSVEQLGFERIVVFVFQTKDAVFRLVVELFSKGNVLVCDGEGMILSVLEQQEWKGRTLKAKQKYLPPAGGSGLDLGTVGIDALRAVLLKSGKESAVKALALELGLGGVYAEEICMIAGVDKAIPPAQLSDKELVSIRSALHRMFSMDPAPVLVFSDSSMVCVKDIVPFPLGHYGGLSSKEFPTLSAALDSVFTVATQTKQLDDAHSHARSRVGKVEEIIRQQEQRITGLEQSADDNQKKGEYVYENYVLVKRILDELASMRKTMSWKEIGDKLKHDKIFKSVDEKSGEVTVEI